MCSRFFSCGNWQTHIEDSCDSSGDHTLHSRTTEFHLVNMKKRVSPFSPSHMLFLCPFFTSLTVVIPQLNQLTLCKAIYSFWYGDEALGRSTTAGNQADGITAQSTPAIASFINTLYHFLMIKLRWKVFLKFLNFCFKGHVTCNFKKTIFWRIFFHLRVISLTLSGELKCWSSDRLTLPSLFVPQTGVVSI